VTEVTHKGRHIYVRFFSNTDAEYFRNESERALLEALRLRILYSQSEAGERLEEPCRWTLKALMQLGFAKEDIKTTLPIKEELSTSTWSLSRFMADQELVLARAKTEEGRTIIWLATSLGEQLFPIIMAGYRRYGNSCPFDFRVQIVDSTSEIT